jgi:hypothetical protein
MACKELDNVGSRLEALRTLLTRLPADDVIAKFLDFFDESNAAAKEKIQQM